MRYTPRVLFIASLTTVLSFFAVVYSSCNKDGSGGIFNTDKCKAISCAHGATCHDGVCTCPSGYEGTYCETTSRDKFIGAHSVLEDGSITPQREYPIVINKAADVTDVWLQNLYNYFKSPVRAYIVNDTIIIPNQQLEGKVVFGKGYIYNADTSGAVKMITMRYEVIDTASQVVDDFGYYHNLDQSEPSVWQ